MDNASFYNVTLKNFAAPWTNRDQNVFVPLNDYVALVVGMVRDDVAFNTLLSADLLYIGGGGLGLPTYSNNNNNHFEQLKGGHCVAIIRAHQSPFSFRNDFLERCLIVISHEQDCYEKQDVDKKQ